jgi:hypothetical protein
MSGRLSVVGRRRKREDAMRSIVRTAALALLVCGAGLAAASAAEKPQPAAADPGEEIKEGVITFGHGIRDGAVRAWGAVKSAVGSGGDTADKPKGSAAKKTPPAASK